MDVPEWLTKSQVAEITGLRAVTIVSYASRGKWRKKAGEGRTVLFWHEDAMRHMRKNAVWYNGFPAAFVAVEERVKYRVTKILEKADIAAPDGFTAYVKVLEPILSEEADPSRAPGPVRHISFSRF